MVRMSVAILVVVSLLSGCASTASNQQKGAGIGAVVGALLGKATGDNAKSRYVWGAAVGALAGAAIGNYMDKQEEEFREELADTGVNVVRNGDELWLQMPGNITFNTGSAAIDYSFHPVLNDVAKILNKYPKTTLIVEGHTDSVGSAEFNMSLSQSRAQSIATYLMTQNVAKPRVTTIGYGEHQPISSNNTAEGRQANRRVELKIIPVT
ncbi:OmpA family protein [Aestuariibacter sp. AA17]|uniref:OmpA family protein n=1 Tax=Fluctibacter corallii TaxID=2984329 RepID=A0ABT3AA76_9ALTE|nr:OmpA family protein [Aestuariibacter sp. AA17]MCV2885584.1 OmpA family protein [Aestuariibacter sp. AA17]